jgi:hypothetical protein
MSSSAGARPRKGRANTPASSERVMPPYMWSSTRTPAARSRAAIASVLRCGLTTLSLIADTVDAGARRGQRHALVRRAFRIGDDVAGVTAFDGVAEIGLALRRLGNALRERVEAEGRAGERGCADEERSTLPRSSPSKAKKIAREGSRGPAAGAHGAEPGAMPRDLVPDLARRRAAFDGARGDRATQRQHRVRVGGDGRMKALQGLQR